MTDSSSFQDFFLLAALEGEKRRNEVGKRENRRAGSGSTGGLRRRQPD